MFVYRLYFAFISRMRERSERHSLSSLYLAADSSFAVLLHGIEFSEHSHFCRCVFVFFFCLPLTAHDFCYTCKYIHCMHKPLEKNKTHMLNHSTRHRTLTLNRCLLSIWIWINFQCGAQRAVAISLPAWLPDCLTAPKGKASTDHI